MKRAREEGGRGERDEMIEGEKGDKIKQRKSKILISSTQ